MKRGNNNLTGLLFGSFNPIHTGHLIIANYFIQYSDIEEIWFVVSPQNPLKTREGLLKEKDRFDLVCRAIEDNPLFSPCDLELKMGTPSYSYKTIEKIQADFPEKEFALIIGSDNLDEFDRWKNYEKIMNMIRIYVYPRGSGTNSGFLDHPGVKLFQAPKIEISSTFIRKAIRAGKDPRYFLPRRVLDKIRQQGYYRQD